MSTVGDTLSKLIITQRREINYTHPHVRLWSFKLESDADRSATCEFLLMIHSKKKLVAMGI